jgi:hypothetical protein
VNLLASTLVQSALEPRRHDDLVVDAIDNKIDPDEPMERNLYEM